LGVQKFKNKWMLVVQSFWCISQVVSESDPPEA
jgi:hypothetical protein